MGDVDGIAGMDGELPFEETATGFSFNFDPASTLEAGAIAELRVELKADLESMAAFPELVSDWKLLRFVRGYKAKPSKGGKSRSKGAAKAYREMCTYVSENNVAGIRADVINQAGGDGGARDVPPEIIKRLIWQVRLSTLVVIGCTILPCPVFFFSFLLPLLVLLVDANVY